MGIFQGPLKNAAPHNNTAAQADVRPNDDGLPAEPADRPPGHAEQLDLVGRERVRTAVVVLLNDSQIGCDFLPSSGFFFGGSCARISATAASSVVISSPSASS